MERRSSTNWLTSQQPLSPKCGLIAGPLLYGKEHVHEWVIRSLLTPSATITQSLKQRIPLDGTPQHPDPRSHGPCSLLVGSTGRSFLFPNRRPTVTECLCGLTDPPFRTSSCNLSEDTPLGRVLYSKPSLLQLFQSRVPDDSNSHQLHCHVVP